MQNKLLFLILIIPNFFLGQQKIIDSLEKITHNKSIPSKEKIIPLSLLVTYYNTDVIKALKIGQKAVSQARKQKETQYGIYAYSSLGQIYAIKGDIQQAYSKIDSCMWYINHSSNQEARATGFNNIGIIKLTLDDKEDGLKDIFISLKIIKAVKESRSKKNIEALSYSILSNYYLFDTKNSEKYSKLALFTALKSKNPHLIGYAQSLRGIRYLAEFEKTKKYYLLDSTINNLKKAITVYESNSEYTRKHSLFNAIANISYAYRFKNELKPNKANIDSINYYLKKAMAIPKENSIEFKMSYYLTLIQAEISKKTPKIEEHFFLEAIEMISNYDKQYKNKYDLYHQIALLYEQTGQSDKSKECFKKALEYYQKYYDEKYTRIGQQQHVKYELSKKEQEINFQKKQNLMYLGIAVALFIALVFLFLIFNFRVKYLRQKKEEVILLAKLKDEETKKLKIEKINAELFAKLKEKETNKLQKKVLAKNMQVSYKNEMLENLKHNLKNNSNFNPGNLDKIIKNEKHLDKNFDDFEKVLNEIHPDFYTKLQEKAKQKLTILDLKYCTYIFMKMPSKEMADLLYVELKTIRMNKYRLKLKLELDKEESLEDFIQKII